MSLKSRLSEPGYVLSALVHVGALAATLMAFSTTEKFDDLQETVPVEVVTDNQFNQIMKGDKSAKEVRPEATAKTEQAASAASQEQPDPPTPVKTQAAPPPPPPPPMPPVRQVEPAKPPPPTPPPVAVLPPPRPEPPAPAPTPPAPMPPVRDVEAEPILPKPEPKPVPKPVAKPVPTPPVVPHPVVAKAPEPKPVPKPKPVEKPKLDQVAKLMDDLPTDTAPAVRTQAVRSRPAPAASETSKFDPTDISKLLTGNAPAQKASASRAQAAQHASLGSPTASAPKMSPSFWAGLDGVMEDQYRQCWSYLGLNNGVKYVPQVRVVYGTNGALEGEPVLINPPSDPSMRSLADSALRAVRRCNPLRIPEQYAPYYEEWRGRVLRFDPEEMAG